MFQQSSKQTKSAHASLSSQGLECWNIWACNEAALHTHSKPTLLNLWHIGKLNAGNTCPLPGHKCGREKKSGRTMLYIGSIHGILPTYTIQSAIPTPEFKTPCFSAPSRPARLIPKLKKLLPLQMESPGHSRSGTTVGGIFKEPWVCPRAAGQHWRGQPISSKNTESRRDNFKATSSLSNGLHYFSHVSSCPANPLIPENTSVRCFIRNRELLQR